MKFIFCFLFVVAAAIILLPANAQDWDIEGPQRGQSLIFDIIYYPDVPRAEFNQRNLNWVEISPDPPPLSAGAFLVTLVDQNARILYVGQINIQPGRNSVTVPYFLNISTITLKNPAGVILLRSILGELAIVNACNQNNHCDPGEEALCPLDCPTAKNSSYPQPPGAPTTLAQPAPLLSATAAPAASSQQLRFGLVATGASLLGLILIAAIIFSRRH